MPAIHHRCTCSLELYGGELHQFCHRGYSLLPLGSAGEATCVLCRKAFDFICPSCGRQTRLRSAPPARDTEVAQMRDGGATFREIGERFGISKGRAEQIYRRTHPAPARHRPSPARIADWFPEAQPVEAPRRITTLATPVRSRSSPT
jgi:hypothetical protein